MKFAIAVIVAGLVTAAGQTLYQQPAMNKDTIVFSYAGDLWKVPRQGGDAVRLTSGPGIEDSPVFSPDGTKIAFRGEYDGNFDVYVIGIEGGVPKRLTYHPSPETPVAWTPDGKRVLFRSNRASYSRFSRLFTIGEDGGLPAAIDLPSAEQGCYSPDGKRLAYLPVAPAFDVWKRYRGGRTTKIWIADLPTLELEKIPRENSNDWSPMWAGNRIYYLSDAKGRFTLFSYDLATKKAAQVIENNGFDIKSASAGPGGIVYEQFGAIHIYDLKSGRTQPVNIRVSGDIPSLRPSFERVGTNLSNPGISPTGVRAVFEARGEIVTVPAEKGDARDITNTPGVAERDPAWSPDGQKIAYFSDESGEYALHVRHQTGGDVAKYDLGKPAAFYYRPRWSPDGKKILYTDSRLGVDYIDLEKKQPVRIDADSYHTPEGGGLDPSWSPDSKWIAYTKILHNHLRAVFLYSLEGGKATQVSDGMSDAKYAVFDRNGKYLYFTASTNRGLSTAWLDMSSQSADVTRSVYVVVLANNEPSPVAPESDEEKPEVKKAEEKKEAAAAEKAPQVRVDLDAIGQRILALPLPARDYYGLAAGKTGILFVAELPHITEPPTGESGFGLILYKFDLKTRKTDKFAENIRAFTVSHNGEKMLIRDATRWAIVPTGTPLKPGEGTLKMDAMEVRVDPKAEWMQMYREVWRIERDFFYDPTHHGLNLETAAKRYEPYLAAVAHRGDLNYLFREMLGELSVGHLYVAGGAMPPVKRVRGGLLGADYSIENGRYRFARVYNGENWNPQLKAPLTAPGVNVKAGEYLLAVNGRDLRSSDDVDSFLESTAGKNVVLRVGPNPADDGSREVTVVPVEDEFGLRNLAWIEENRRKVDQMTNGRVAYVYLPNTAGAGMTNFNRYYFAQVGKEGAVIDERYNGGGQIAEYIVDYLRRPLLAFFTTRWGDSFSVPQNAIFGPKAMIVNEYAGSGGDALPWMFRQAKVGPLVGKRTWGGLVGIFGFPRLMDGGSVTAPNLAFWNPWKNDWDVENHGVPPDYDVEMEPAAVKAGRDPQLEKAVELVMAELKKKPLPEYNKPAYPNYHRSDGLGAPPR